MSEQPAARIAKSPYGTNAVQLSAFGVAEDGSVATMIGLAVIPLCLALGLAVDGGMAYGAHSKLQGAIDAAALASARASTTEGSDIEADARMYFDANFPIGYFGSEVVDFDAAYDENTHELTVDARIEIPTSFMRVAGLPTIPVSATATALHRLNGIELALVLDVTGSMSDPDPAGGTKIESLKTAAGTLLDVIYGDEETLEDVSISIVPYTTSVNLGSDRIDLLTGFDPAAFGTDGWKGCVEARAEPYDQDDTPPSEAAFTALLWPEVVDDPDTEVDETGYNPSNDPNAYCPDNEVLPLTQEKSVVADHIEDLIADGGTLTNVGFNWGWRTISPRWQEAWGAAEVPVAYDHPTIGKAIVFMTDGKADLPKKNWPHFYSAYGFLQEERLGSKNDVVAEKEVNDRLLESCELAKDQGIEVYTIMFDLDDPVIESTYRACASSNAHFFDTPDGEALEAAFRDIAGQLTSLRLSH